jgi:hypothetical protein
MRETGVFPLSRFPLFREWDVSGDVMVAVGEFVQSRNRAIVQLSMVLRDCTNVLAGLFRTLHANQIEQFQLFGTIG